MLSKTCACCGTKYTRLTWEALELLGVNEYGEWRNCTCGSTLLKGKDE